MEDLREFVNTIQVVSGYRQIVTAIGKNFKQANYDKRIREYCNEKSKLNLKSMPSLIPEAKMQSPAFPIEHTTFLKQARYFGQLAKNATTETKPLLYHYAENSLFAFFVYSLFSYDKKSFRHGLQIEWGGSWKDTKVKIENKGFFSRIIDCYSLLGVNTHFSILRYENLQKTFVVKNDNPYPLMKEPQLTLEQIIEMRKQVGGQQGYYNDVIDFVLLFYASSLARYRPYYWNAIVKGEEGTEIIWFEKCFDRFDILLIRLIRTLLYMSRVVSEVEQSFAFVASDYESEQYRIKLGL